MARIPGPSSSDTTASKMSKRKQYFKRIVSFCALKSQQQLLNSPHTKLRSLADITWRATASIGLFVPLPANEGQAEAVTNFLHAGHSLLKDEPLTLQWYALRYESSSPTFAIFDTFAEEEGRSAHLNGKIAEALVANAPTLIAGTPQINKTKILASKIQEADVKLGLRVLAEAKPNKVEDVKQFLIGALPLVEEETLTPQWYAIQLEGSNIFGILDFSEAEVGRQAHLNGKVAAALFAKADELFVKTPEVVKVDVVASRVI